MADMNIKLKLEDSNYQSKSKSDKTINTFLPKTSASLGKTVGILGAIVGSLTLLKNSSQHLKGTFEIFKRAFQLILKPIGDFVSMLLRPLAILMLKWVRGILGVKSKEELKEKGKEIIEKAKEGDPNSALDLWDLMVEKIASNFDGKDIANTLIRIIIEFILKLPSFFIRLTQSLVETLLDIGTAIGNVIYDNIIKPIYKAVSELGFKIGVWIGENIIIPMAEKFSELKNSVGAWIEDKIIAPIKQFLYAFYVEIMDIYYGVSTWISENITTPIKNFLKFILTEINKASEKISSWIDENIIEPVKSFFNTLKSAIQRWINRLLSLMGDSGSSKGDKKSVNDAIITPKGDIITTNPKDYLIATKNPSDLLSNNKGINNLNININIEKIDSEMRIRELAEKISIEIARSNSYGV